MATQTHIYFDDSQCFASYDWDDVALKITAVHVINRQDIPLTIQEVDSNTNVVLNEFTVAVGATVNANLTPPQQKSVVLDARGRITNIYFRTA